MAQKDIVEGNLTGFVTVAGSSHEQPSSANGQTKSQDPITDLRERIKAENLKKLSGPRSFMDSLADVRDLTLLDEEAWRRFQLVAEQIIPGYNDSGINYQTLEPGFNAARKAQRSAVDNRVYIVAENAARRVVGRIHPSRTITYHPIIGVPASEYNRKSAVEKEQLESSGNLRFSNTRQAIYNRFNADITAALNGVAISKQDFYVSIIMELFVEKLFPEAAFVANPTARNLR